MKTVSLSQGKVALLDDDDFARVAAFKWFAFRSRSGVWYAIRNVRREDGTRTTQEMQRFILGAPVGAQIDHIDNDGLNNQRSNLRLATRQENKRNSRRYRGGSSRFKGVSAFGSKWKAQAQINGRRRHLGLFEREEDAALAYDAAARSYYNEFACVNFPREGERCALVASSA